MFGRGPAARLARRYRREGEVYLVEVHLRELRALFNSLDPAPFLDKDLDDEAEQYIVGAVEEFPLVTPLKLVFHVPAIKPDDPTASVLADSIRGYFDYRAAHAGRRLEQLLSQGRLSLLIGVGFLFACLGARGLVAGMLTGTLRDILAEGLLISGWVAMWRPLEIYLYDWWPLVRRRRILRKISALPVELRITGRSPA
ncbi:hypothetical protein [Immundisolibacter sp.]|uniref:hypothetical protein n=1 Tax=Immundisolibacter sp. TaxID=1934948 RepID=UPI0026230533|nr:hypothetical protein [Immundisolibacter sp.]MDD3651326.1 hypothetical protein [Immundisolibacter sp.]